MDKVLPYSKSQSQHLSNVYSSYWIRNRDAYLNPSRRMAVETGSAVVRVGTPGPLPLKRSARAVERQFWKWNFRLTLLPLMLWGIPTHLTLLRRPITTTGAWIKSLPSCSSPGIFLLTLLLFAGSASLNIYMLSLFCHLFIGLVIRGELRLQFLLNILDLLQNLPVLLPMNYLWLKGYVVRDLVSSYSRPMPCEASELFQLYQESSLEWREDRPGRARPKLILMYGLAIFIHTVHAVMYGGRVKRQAYGESTVVSHFGNYWLGPVLSTVLLPAYMTFCWATRRQFQVLAYYLRSLVSVKMGPTTGHFDRFKAGFKETCDRVQVLNGLSSIYISSVILSILVSIYIEIWDFGNEVLSDPGGPMNTKGPTGISGLLGLQSLTEASTAATGLFGQSPPNQASTGAAGLFGLPPLEENVPFPPGVVRSFIATAFILVVKIGLIVLTIWQAVGANDEARYLIVWLNDFVTEPNSGLPAETYQAFRLLKYYVHSRMLLPRQSLIRIPIVGLLPPLKERLLSYQQS